MIAIKILNVMTKIGPIIKDKTNEEKGFDYASIASIIIRAREAMIEEKVIMIPLKLNQVVQKGNDVIIDMVYRFYDAEPNEDGKCDYMDVNIPGEGADKEGWAVYKALSGAYKYAITQTFAIPTIDDAEKDKYTTNNEDIIKIIPTSFIMRTLDAKDNIFTPPYLSAVFMHGLISCQGIPKKML